MLRLGGGGGTFRFWFYKGFYTVWKDGGANDVLSGFEDCDIGSTDDYEAS